MRLIIFLGVVAIAACGSGPPGSGEVGPDALESAIEAGHAPLILDVRTEAEYAAGHVPGAVNIPHDQVAARISEVEARSPDRVVVYCKSGRRAGIAGEALEAAGIPVEHLQGDMTGWIEDGRPIER